jgi:methionyl aminopeptidase
MDILTDTITDTEKKISLCLEASSIHKQIRRDLKDYIKETMYLKDICSFIENKIRMYSSNQLNDGIAFPTGLCLNHMAAHWTPLQNSTEQFRPDDILKIDFGVHINGIIIDSAFTIKGKPVDTRYDSVIDASKDAVYSIIKHIGVGTRVNELGQICEEVVNSYETELNGIFTPVKTLKQLYGHSIEPWKIHGGVLIPSYDNKDTTQIEDNSFLAVEVFTTNGSGNLLMGKETSHFSLQPQSNKNISPRTEELLFDITKNIRTLPFSQKHIAKFSKIKYFDSCLDELYRYGLLQKYPPLYEKNKDSITAQFEHTVFVSEKNKINFTFAEDY